MIRNVASSATDIAGGAGRDPDDLRRAPRVSFCCRVDVRERHGVWTAVTEDVCARGCRIVTPSFPRLGSRLAMTLCSDLFPQALDVVAETVWATSEQLGVLFVDTVRRRGALSPVEWIEQVLAHGRVPGSTRTGSHVVPVVTLHASRAGSGARLGLPRRLSLDAVPLRAHASPAP